MLKIVPVSELELDPSTLAKARASAVIGLTTEEGKDVEIITVNGDSMNGVKPFCAIFYPHKPNDLWAVKTERGQWIVVMEAQAPVQQDAGDLYDYPAIAKASLSSTTVNGRVVSLIAGEVSLLEWRAEHLANRERIRIETESGKSVNIHGINTPEPEIMFLRHRIQRLQLTAVWLGRKAGLK